MILGFIIYTPADPILPADHPLWGASSVGVFGAQVRAGLWIHPEHLHVHPVLRLLHQGVPLEKAKSREDCGRVREGELTADDLFL